jgi:hypothetical protein
MAYTFNLDDDFLGAEELQLMKTKQAILEKLRVRFGEIAPHDGWAATHTSDALISNQCIDHPR